MTHACLPEGRVIGGWVKRVKGLSTDGQLLNSHGDGKYSTGSTVGDIVTTV